MDDILTKFAANHPTRLRHHRGAASCRGLRSTQDLAEVCPEGGGVAGWRGGGTGPTAHRPPPLPTAAGLDSRGAVRVVHRRLQCAHAADVAGNRQLRCASPHTGRLACMCQYAYRPVSIRDPRADRPACILAEYASWIRVLLRQFSYRQTRSASIQMGSGRARSYTARQYPYWYQTGRRRRQYVCSMYAALPYRYHYDTGSYITAAWQTHRGLWRPLGRLRAMLFLGSIAGPPSAAREPSRRASANTGPSICTYHRERTCGRPGAQCVIALLSVVLSTSLWRAPQGDPPQRSIFSQCSHKVLSHLSTHSLRAQRMNHRSEHSPAVGMTNR